MAIIKGKIEFVETVAATAVTPPLPEHVIGDLLLVFAVADNVVTAFTTTDSSSGWTIGGQSQSPGTTTSACRSGWFYKVAESAEELLVLNSASTTWAATALCIEGANTTTPVDASNGNGITIAANPGT